MFLHIIYFIWYKEKSAMQTREYASSVMFYECVLLSSWYDM